MVGGGKWEEGERGKGEPKGREIRQPKSRTINSGRERWKEVVESVRSRRRLPKANNFRKSGSWSTERQWPAHIIATLHEHRFL